MLQLLLPYKSSAVAAGRVMVLLSGTLLFQCYSQDRCCCCFNWKTFNSECCCQVQMLLLHKLVPNSSSAFDWTGASAVTRAYAILVQLPGQGLMLQLVPNYSSFLHGLYSSAAVAGSSATLLLQCCFQRQMLYSTAASCCTLLLLGSYQGQVLLLHLLNCCNCMFRTLVG